MTALPPDQIARLEAAHAALTRGHARETEGALDEALKGYDEAISILSAWPGPPPAGVCRDLGVAWMNRGNVLQKQEDPAALTDADAAYDRAITLLNLLPLASDPAFANSLGAAWLNRGRALHRQGTATAIAAAVEAYAKSIEVLRALPLEANPWFRINLAGAWMNKANVLMALGDTTRAPEARTAAKESLALVAPGEQAEPIYADIGIKARRAQCDAIGQLLGTPDPSLDGAELTTEASDAVDDGLALVRHWEQKGLPAFRPLALRLFLFGARLYARYQPQFVAEFLLENLDAETTPGAFTHVEDFYRVAVEAIMQTRARLNQTGMITPGTPSADRLLEIAQSLTKAEARINELHAKHFAPAGQPPVSPA
ncbi:hypothetical protein MASR2M8_20990 [Opitutaceae bacterium]